MGITEGMIYKKNVNLFIRTQSIKIFKKKNSIHINTEPTSPD